MSVALLKPEVRNSVGVTTALLTALVIVDLFVLIKTRTPRLEREQRQVSGRGRSEERRFEIAHATRPDHQNDRLKW